MGDWDDVQVELGLKSPPEIPRRRRPFSPEIDSLLTGHKEIVSPKTLYERKTEHKKAKSKKSKMAKQSRKKNRK